MKLQRSTVITIVFLIFAVLGGLPALTSCGETAQDKLPASTAGTGTAKTGIAETVPQPAPPQPESTGGGTVESSGSTVRSSAGSSGPVYGYTYGQASGNHAVAGAGDLPTSEPVDIPLGGTPAWVVGVPLGEDTAWVAALADGRVEAFRLSPAGEVTPEPLTNDRLPPGEPPLVRSEAGSLTLVTAGNGQESTLTHPVPASSGAKAVIGVQSGGGLFVEPGPDPPVTALPDARLVRSEKAPGGRIAVLSDPTDRYAHGVLGDAFEAASLTVLRPAGDSADGFEIESRIQPASGGVFETIAPLWFEAPDGEQLLVVTESTASEGSRISVYSLDGRLAASGPFIGEPKRWRHLLAAGPFGPEGQTELAAVRTPHLGGVVEFYRLDLEAGRLEIAATLPGYTSHRIRTRNLDTARAGDLNGDGRWELLVPNDSYTQLGAVTRTPSGAQTDWTLPTGGTIVTNLASATDGRDHAQVAFGRSDGVLRVFL